MYLTNDEYIYTLLVIVRVNMYSMSQCGISVDAEAFCELQIWFDRI